MDKFYDTVGTSIMPGGVKKVRFANGCAARAKHLKKVSKHTEVLLWELPHPMHKEAATLWLVTNHPEQCRGIEGLVVPDPVADPDQMELNFDQPEQNEEMAAALGAEEPPASSDEEEVPENIDPEPVAETPAPKKRRSRSAKAPEAAPADEDELPEDIDPELMAEIERREAEAVE